MSNPYFPLRQRPRDAGGLSVTPQDTRIRSTVDAGPPIMRPRFTAAIESWSVKMGPVTGPELSTLLAFYGTTLSQGTLPFAWKDKFGADATFRFATPIKHENAVPNSDPAKRRWTLTFTVEQLP